MISPTQECQGKDQPPQPLPSIQNFSLEQRLSAGAFGTVYLGKKVTTNQVYAIKVLRKADLVRKNMTTNVVHERSALLHSHSNDFCVKLYYSLQTHEHIYFVMEYCLGGDLKTLLKKMRFFPIAMAGFYVAEVASALDYLHTRGVIHRDIKPDNMLIDKQGHVKLTDFGLSEVGLKNKLVGSPLLNDTFYTPGMLASLGQNITFSHCSDKGLASPISSGDFISATSGGSGMIVHTPSSGEHGTGSRSLLPIQHSTPVGSFGANAALHVNPVVIQTKHRKVRIPLRKLGSRTQLGASSISLTGSVSESSSSISSLSSSWSIVSTPSETTPNETEASPPEQEKITFKKVKLSPKNDNAIPFPFENSSFLSVSFNFIKHINSGSGRSSNSPPSSLPIPPAPAPSFADATTPTTGNSLLNNSFFNTPEFSSIQVQELVEDKENLFFTGSVNNNHSGDAHRHHDDASPETGRFRMDRQSASHHPFFSLPVLATNNCDVNGIFTPSPSKHHVKAMPPPKYLAHHPAMSGPKSPSCPLLDSMLSNSNPKKRKRDDQTDATTDREPSMPSSTGLTADVSALLLHNLATPPPVPLSFLQSTPVNQPPRLLGTPDYLAPELIRLAMMDQTDCCGERVTTSSDWWSLGVCFYEFVVGILPFNDDTPEQIFKNILDRNIEYPEGMDERLVEILDGLICSNIATRFEFENLKKFDYLPIFGLQKESDWKELRSVNPPWVPVANSDFDTGYFCGGAAGESENDKNLGSSGFGHA